MLHLVPWFLTVQLIGVAAVPWAFLLFRGLPDRGYGVAKVLGLVVFVYAYWALVMARVLQNGFPALLVVLALYLAASVILLRNQREEISFFLRYRWRLLAFQEAVFLGALLALVLLRVFVPDVTVTTAVTGVTTEQPMDLAFLASSIRSPAFPVEDPWLAGHPVSYYYFGYLIVGVLAQLSAAPAHVAYNLALATVFALAAQAAFAVTADAVALAGLSGRSGRRLTGLPVIGGLVSVALLLVAGNLTGGLQAVRRLTGAQDGGLLGNPYWWWDATRFIKDGTGADPITEVPAFSFVLGDLHPHLMSLPFTLLALALALGWLARTDAPEALWPRRQPGELFLIALLIGVLGFVNTWDFPVYLAVFALAVAVRRLWEDDRIDKPWMVLAADVLVPVASVAVLALVLYLPFYVNLDTQTQGLVPVARTGTSGAQLVLMWAPLLAAVLPVVALAWRRLETRALGREWLVLAVGLPLAAMALWSVVALAWSAVGTVAGVQPPTLGEALARWLLLALPLAVVGLALAALAPARWMEHLRPGMAFLSLVLLAGVTAVVLPELVFVRDLFGTRMNTVFKLYYQAWLLLSLGAGIGVPWALSQARPRRPLRRAAAALGLLGAALVLAVSLAYGPAAAFTRARTSPATSVALDGLATFRRLYPDEAEAVSWLRRNAPRDAVVLEAVGNDYSDFSRVSAVTGIPTVLGWEGHELQWRGGAALFADRRRDAASVYAGTDPAEARRVLAFYEVDYVFVGRLERQAYGPDVEQRFLGLVPQATEAYRSGDVSVYRVPRE